MMRGHNKSLRHQVKKVENNCSVIFCSCKGIHRRTSKGNEIGTKEILCSKNNTTFNQGNKYPEQFLCVHENVTSQRYSWPPQIGGDRQRGGVTQIWVNFGGVWRNWEGQAHWGGGLLSCEPSRRPCPLGEGFPTMAHPRGKTDRQTHTGLTWW